MKYSEARCCYERSGKHNFLNVYRVTDEASLKMYKHPHQWAQWCQSSYLHLIRCLSLDWWCHSSVQELVPERPEVCVATERPRHPSVYTTLRLTCVIIFCFDILVATQRLSTLWSFSVPKDHTHSALVIRKVRFADGTTVMGQFINVVFMDEPVWWSDPFLNPPSKPETYREKLYVHFGLNTKLHSAFKHQVVVGASHIITLPEFDPQQMEPDSQLKPVAKMSSWVCVPPDVLLQRVTPRDHYKCPKSNMKNVRVTPPAKRTKCQRLKRGRAGSVLGATFS